MVRMASTMDNNPLVSSAVREILPSRRRESRLSPACATFSSFLKPRNPQLPLIVWMVRKMLDRSSSQDGSDSSFTSSLSSRSRFSMLSTRKSLIRSSIAPLHPYDQSRSTVLPKLAPRARAATPTPSGGPPYRHHPPPVSYRVNRQMKVS